MEIVFKLFAVLVLLGGARFVSFPCFTELCLELGWESAQRDPFQKMTRKTKRDFVFNSRLSGSFIIALFVIGTLTLTYRIFAPI